MGRRLGIFSKLIILVAVLLLEPSGRSQAQSAPVDVYANMIGKWVGYDDTMVDGVVKHIPVEVVITRGKDSVRLDYTYSRLGQPDFSTATKFMKLDPRRSEMTLRWKGLFEGGSKYKTRNLNEFARTGYGSFTATGAAVGPSGGKGMFVFSLDSVAMSYEWRSANTAGIYATVTVFSMHRSEQKPQSDDPE